MFGTNKYQKIKSTKFNSDNERKKYFAILNYYKKKKTRSIHSNSIKNNKKI